MKRRITSLLICAAMLLSLCPIAAAEEPESGLCPHHPEHTAECGYDEETGTPCGYVCEICNASEETEGGAGWDYTWLDALCPDGNDVGTLEAAGRWADRYSTFGISDAYAEYLQVMPGTVDGLRDFQGTITVDYDALISGPDAMYAGRFRITDMRNQVTLSEPSYYILIDDLSQLEVESIAPELYDGEEHRPAVHLLFNGVRILEEGVDYKVEYQDNVEPGWATITVTSLTEEVPGTLTAHFLIAETLTEVVEELIREVPDHLPGDACEESGLEWFEHIVSIDVAMMGRVQLTEEELAGLDHQSGEKLNTQYAAMLEYYQDYLKLTDQNATIYGAVTLANSLGKLSAAQRRPTDPQAVEALNEAAAAAKEKLYSVYHIQFLDSEEQAALSFLEGEFALVKLQIPSSLRTETLEVCQVVDGNPEPQGVEYWMKTESGRNYILFYADALGYYALFARQRSTGGSSSNNSSGNTPSTTTPAAAYPPTVRQPKRGGTLTVSPTDPKAGTTVTITATPETGYAVDAISVTLSNGTPVSVRENSDGTYSFTQPSGRVTVTGTFRAAQSGTAETPAQSGAYTDVSAGDWCYEAVRFVQENSLMNGYSDGRFAPNAVLTRAQLAQILYNKEGRPAVDYQMNFTDVQDGAWCADAVRWAASRGIAGGYEDGAFRPKAPVTREQMAVMLWRYAGSPAPVNQTLSFSDADAAGGYARTALCWAVEQGIMRGNGGRLDPKGLATRAHAAQILKNFIEGQTQIN